MKGVFSLSENADTLWYAYGRGQTINTSGSDGGIILLDEEMIGARITLEKDSIIAPFSITCGIYGLMVHTAFAKNQKEALETYTAMKKEITEFMSKDTAFGGDDDYHWLEQFTAKY